MDNIATTSSQGRALLEFFYAEFGVEFALVVQLIKRWQICHEGEAADLVSLLAYYSSLLKRDLDFLSRDKLCFNVCNGEPPLDNTAESFNLNTILDAGESFSNDSTHFSFCLDFLLRSISAVVQRRYVKYFENNPFVSTSLLTDELLHIEVDLASHTMHEELFDLLILCCLIGDHIALDKMLERASQNWLLHLFSLLRVKTNKELCAKLNTSSTLNIIAEQVFIDGPVLMHNDNIFFTKQMATSDFLCFCVKHNTDFRTICKNASISLSSDEISSEHKRQKESAFYAFFDANIRSILTSLQASSVKQAQNDPYLLVLALLHCGVLSNAHVADEDLLLLPENIKQEVIQFLDYSNAPPQRLYALILILTKLCDSYSELQLNLPFIQFVFDTGHPRKRFVHFASKSFQTYSNYELKSNKSSLNRTLRFAANLLNIEFALSGLRQKIELSLDAENVLEQNLFSCIKVYCKEILDVAYFPPKLDSRLLMLGLTRQSDLCKIFSQIEIFLVSYFESCDSIEFIKFYNLKALMRFYSTLVTSETASSVTSLLNHVLFCLVESTYDGVVSIKHAILYASILIKELLEPNCNIDFSVYILEWVKKLVSNLSSKIISQLFDGLNIPNNHLYSFLKNETNATDESNVDFECFYLLIWQNYFKLLILSHILSNFQLHLISKSSFETDESLTQNLYSNINGTRDSLSSNNHKLNDFDLHQESTKLSNPFSVHSRKELLTKVNIATLFYQILITNRIVKDLLFNYIRQKDTSSIYDDLSGNAILSMWGCSLPPVQDKLDLAKSSKTQSNALAVWVVANNLVLPINKDAQANILAYEEENLTQFFFRAITPIVECCTPKVQKKALSHNLLVSFEKLNSASELINSIDSTFDIIIDDLAQGKSEIEIKDFTDVFFQLKVQVKLASLYNGIRHAVVRACLDARDENILSNLASLQDLFSELDKLKRAEYYIPILEALRVEAMHSSACLLCVSAKEDLKERLLSIFEKALN